MLKYKFRIFILFVLLLAPLCVNAEVRNISTNVTLVQGEYEATLLNLVNNARIEAGVEPLSLDQNIVNASRKRATEISVNYDRNHLRTDNRHWSTVIGEYGVAGNYFGENIAYAQYAITPTAVFNMWMNSPPHKNNILNSSYTTLGIGIVKSQNGYYYWVQNFGNGIQNEYVPSNEYNEVYNSYVLRYEDSLAYNVSHDNLENITLNVGESFDTNLIINTINNSDYPESVSFKLLDWSSSNPDAVSVTNSSLYANHAGSSVISTTFGGEEISFIATVNDDNSDFKGIIQVTTNDKDNPLKIDVDDRLSYEIENEANVSVTQFYKNGEIVNKSALNISLCLDKDCTQTIKPIRYESDDMDVVDFIQGEFIFNNSGKSTITAIFENGISVKIPVNVYYFSFSKNEYELNINESINTSIVSDNKELTYSSDDTNIVSIDEYGKITGISSGTTYINAYDNINKLFARAMVTINDNRQVSIEVGQCNTQLILGESLNLVVTVNPSDVVVKYTSSNESVAVVDSNGKVTTVGVGDAVITVMAASEKKSVAISVKDREIIDSPTKIEIDRTSVELFELETIKLNAIVSPIQTLRWYSDDDRIASVDNDGLITAIKNGETTIHVVSEDGCEVSVKVVIKAHDVAIDDIVVDKDNVVLVEGESTSIKANVYPDNTTLNKDLIWKSSNENVAIVSNGGLITAIGEGDAIITITSVNGVSKTVNVKVNKKLIPISNIVVDRDNISLIKGDVATIKASIYPLNTTDNLNLTWSSNNVNVAVVDNNGKITAISAGDAIITVTAVNGVSTSIKVSVQNVEVTDIKLNYNELLLRDDFILKITSYSPSDAVLDMSRVVWSSSNTSVVIVKDGLLIPVGIGEAVISVHYGEYHDECHVVIDDETTIKSLGNIIVREDPSNCIDSILINNTLQLEFIINDELKVLSDYENFKLNWETSNNLVMDNEGNVKFLSPGLGYVRVSFGMYSVTRYFNVYDIKIMNDKDTIKVGDSTNINVLVTTPEVSSNNAHYEVNNTSIATISSDGLLHAINPGEVVVTIYSLDRKVSKSITIRVIINNNNNNNNNNNHNNKPIVITKPIVSNNNNKDDDSLDNEFVENKFDIVFDNNTFTIENKNGKANLSLNNVADRKIKLSVNEELIAYYQIDFDGDSKLLKDATFNVKIPCNFSRDKYDSVYFARISNGEVMEIIDATIDNYVEFITDHFSEYAVIGTKSKSSMKEENVPDNKGDKKTSDDTKAEKDNSHLIRFITLFIIAWVLLFILINKLITSFFYKKKVH